MDSKYFGPMMMIGAGVVMLVISLILLTNATTQQQEREDQQFMQECRAQKSELDCKFMLKLLHAAGQANDRRAMQQMLQTAGSMVY